MKKIHYYKQLPVQILLGSAVISLTLLSDSQAYAQSRYGNSLPNQVHYDTHTSRYIQDKSPQKYGSLGDRIRDKRHISYQTPPPPGMFQQWVDWEPEYKLSPGDQLDIIVSSAPELSRTLTVGPDGRVVMPMTRPIMAAGRTFEQLQAELTGELSKQLRDPTIAISPRAYSPSQIYVGGQVNQPGTYTLPGRIGALEGLFLAGGMAAGAKTKQVAVLRRAPNGGMMMRTVNIKNGLINIREYNDNIQLRRGDIIYVPQTTLAEVGNFVQAVRNTFPIDFTTSYQFGQNFGTNIVP